MSHYFKLLGKLESTLVLPKSRFTFEHSHCVNEYKRGIRHNSTNAIGSKIFPDLRDEKNVKHELEKLPLKPTLPTSEMCCMSACKNCVWNIYDLDLAKFQAEARNLRTEFLRQGINENQIPKMLNEAELQSEIDPSIEAFNALIRKLNE